MEEIPSTKSCFGDSFHRELFWLWWCYGNKLVFWGGTSCPA